jgi:hypothetical protein
LVAWIGDAGMKIGNRARVKQPKMPSLVWEVCELKPGSSFSWRSTSVGVTTVATHTLETVGTNRTAPTLGIEQSGPLARLVGALTGRRTVRYVQMECDGSRSQCESGPVH